jgi:hypothetical protein
MREASDPGGRDRTGRVLDASFLDGLTELPLAEVRRRRDLAFAEREFQSYLRRMVQTRQDILESEHKRRAEGRESVPVVERLKSALSRGPQSRGRGEALRFALSSSDTGEAERRAASVVAPSEMANPDRLSDEDLGQRIEALDRIERSISSDRAAVLRVHDRLQEELKRRYQEDPAVIPTEL